MGSISQVADWKPSAVAGTDNRRVRMLETSAVMGVALAAGLLAICVRPLGDPDLFWHLKTGELILATGTIPVLDTFSHTAHGASWTAHEYVSEIVMAVIYRLSGWRGLQLSFGLIAAAACWLVYLRCRSSRALAGVCLLLGVLAAAPSIGARPQMFTFLFASLFLFLLDRVHAGQDRRWLMVLPAVIALWTNMHAGFVLGLGIVWLEVILAFIQRLSKSRAPSTLVRSLTFTAIASTLAALLNPHGWRLIAYAFETLRSPAQQSFIQEWASPNFHLAMFLPFGILIVVLMISLAAGKRTLTLREYAYLTIFLFASLRSGRHIPIFVLVAIPIIASCLAPLFQTRQLQQRPATFAFAAVALLMVTLAGFRILATMATPEVAVQQSYPEQAVDFMRLHHTPSPMFNFYDWGGYLIWALPSHPVFIDGRADVYGDQRMEQYMKVYSGVPGWDRELNQRGIQSALVQPESAIASLLRMDPSWRVAFADSTAIVFERTSSASPKRSARE